MKESVSVCEAVGHGADGTNQTSVEAGKLNNATTHPSLRQRLQNPRQYERSQPLVCWLVRVTRTLVISIISPHKCLEMENHKKGQMLLRELGIKEAVFEPHLTGQDRTMLTEMLKKRLIQQGLQCSYGTLVALLSPLWGKNMIKLKRLCQVSVT